MRKRTSWRLAGRRRRERRSRARRRRRQRHVSRRGRREARVGCPDRAQEDVAEVEAATTQAEATGFPIHVASASRREGSADAPAYPHLVLPSLHGGGYL